MQFYCEKVRRFFKPFFTADIQGVPVRKVHFVEFGKIIDTSFFIPAKVQD